MKKLKIAIALLAALYTVVIVYLIYQTTTPWRFKIIKNDFSPAILSEKTDYTIKDLNDDHKVEVFRIVNNQSKRDILISVLDSSAFNVIQEAHFQYPFVETKRHFQRYPLPTVDINDDGWEEVIVLCHSDSVLFLNILDVRNNIEILQYHPILKRKRVLSDQNAVWDTWDLWLEDLKKADLNNDGVDELILALNAGKAEWPRGVFIIDLVKHRIINQFLTGVKIQLIEMADFDQDGNEDLILSTNAPGNIDWPVSFSDFNTYLLLLNTRLEIIYNKRMGNESGSFITRPFRNGDKNWYISQLMSGKKDEISKLLVYDEKLHEKQDLLIETQNIADQITWKNNSYILTTEQEKGVVLFKWDSEKQKLEKIASFADSKSYRFEDVLGDAAPEIWAGNSEHLYLLDMQMNVLADLDWYADMPMKFRELPFELKEISSGLNKKAADLTYYIGTHHAFVKLRLITNPIKYYSFYFSPFIFLIIFALLLQGNNFINKARVFVTYFYHFIKKSENAILLLDDKGKVITFNNKLQHLLNRYDRIEKGKHYRRIFPADGKMIPLIHKSIQTDTIIREKISFESAQNSFIGEVVISPFKYFFNITNSYLIEIKNTTTQVIEDRASNWQRTTRRMIHDIKNPLSAVQLNIQTLYMKLKDKDSKIAEELKPEIDMAYSELQRVRNISHDFLKFHDLEKTQKETIKIKDLFDELLIHFQAFQTDELVIQTEIEENLPDIKVDKRQAQMVLQALVENAIDAIEDNKGRILISAYLENDHKYPLKRSMIIDVSDSGKGIPDSYKNKIFEPHFSSKVEGTGMGLVFVKHIVLQHDGKINIESREGFGTTVTLKIPV
ncbi:MAG: hypothetical protein H6627_12830 [Calditrichae bacterium]|nr:hypothetical protein [Calditrichia bacterium]